MAKIVVGVDTSEGSRRALEWAVDEGRRRGVTVEAVYVWQLPTFAATPLGAVPIELGNFEDDAQQKLNAMIDEVDAGGGAPVVRTVLTGHPASCLLEAASDADLLVVGTRGHGGFVGLLLGSTSQQVTQHAPCPVVVVPGP